jgi:predicted acetylornithine/succinylornithine family transaminase
MVCCHTTAEIADLARQYLTPNYRNAAVVYSHGEGPWNVDLDGHRALDFSGGVAVNLLGHGHRDLADAIADQAGKLIHQSNYWHNEHAAPLARDLCERFSDACATATGKPEPARAFFCNSGAEANEALVKMARRWHAKVNGQARPGVVTVHGSFHGRSYAAMSATAQPKYQEGFEPLVPGFRYARFGDIVSIGEQIDDSVGMVLIEIVQGEGGVHVAPAGFFAALRQMCDARGVLLGLDEVQTGLGRTGSFFAFEQERIAPDLVSLAKGLAGGVPIGALLAKDAIAQAFQPGTHASTFGANALACCAARTVLAVIERDRLVEHAARMGQHLLGKLREAFDDQPYTLDVRGRGLMTGVQVKGDAKAVIERARGLGLLLSLAGSDVLRMTPPLVVDAGHCDLAVARLRAAADAVLLAPP